MTFHTHHYFFFFFRGLNTGTYSPWILHKVMRFIWLMTPHECWNVCTLWEYQCPGRTASNHTALLKSAKLLLDAWINFFLVPRSLLSSTRLHLSKLQESYRYQTGAKASSTWPLVRQTHSHHIQIIKNPMQSWLVRLFPDFPWGITSSLYGRTRRH